VIRGATLTLLALLIGFSFSMAITRYDQRKNFGQRGEREGDFRMHVARISSLTHLERAAFGEQITIWQPDSRSASLMTSPRSVAEASSSRSRNMGLRRRGASPRAVCAPTSRRGGRYDSSDLCSHVAQDSSRWL